mgnify:CR=1 FL=1
MSVSNDVIIHGKNIEIHALTNNTNGNTYAQYQLNFNPVLTLTNYQEHPEMRNSKDDEWEMCLIKATFWNTMPNITNNRNNNTLIFKIGVINHLVMFGDGNYTLQTINDEINYYLSANGLSLNLITFIPNLSTSKTRAILKPTLYIDFTNPTNTGIAQFLGFTGQILDNSAGVNNLIYMSNLEPKMNYYGDDAVLVEQIQVRVDIVNHRVYANKHNDNYAYPTDILYEMGVNSIPSTLQVERSNNFHYIKIKQQNGIPNLRISFTNQDGVLLPLNKEASVQLQLKRNMDMRVQKQVKPASKSIVYDI